MELYTFGHNADSSLLAATTDSTPTCIFRAKVIRVLWSSWCDVIIQHQNNASTWKTEYRGTGLSPAQKHHVATSNPFKGALGGQEKSLDFFGTAMHDGLRGYVIYDTVFQKNIVVIFATDAELESDVPEIQSCSAVNGMLKIVAIQMGSGGDVLASTLSHEHERERVIHLKDLTELRRHADVELDFPPETMTIAPFLPVHICTNSTTTTALDKDGRVYTATRDARYPKCLGRTYEGTSDFQPVPYLSETQVTKIASGGYMSAAMSAEGELYLWGQACPGSDGELAVLEDDATTYDSREFGISAEGEQDHIVKCLTIRINGEEAQAYNVAIGHGHILVAAELPPSGGVTERAVFAAGDNSKGQLGFDLNKVYLSNFEEILGFRGKRIQSLAASGWTSYIVLVEDPSMDSE